MAIQPDMNAGPVPVPGGSAWPVSVNGLATVIAYRSGKPVASLPDAFSYQG